MFVANLLFIKIRMSSNLTYACQNLEITFIFSLRFVFFSSQRRKHWSFFFLGKRIYIFFEGRLAIGSWKLGVCRVLASPSIISHTSKAELSCALNVTFKSIKMRLRLLTVMFFYIYIYIYTFFFCILVWGKFEPLVVCKTQI